MPSLTPRFGAVDGTFLHRSIGLLDPKEPLTAHHTTSILDVVDMMQDNHVGCMLIVDDEGKLAGVFTERDLLLRLFGKPYEELDVPVSEYMHANPHAASMTTSVGHALNLMSDGGFRHLPIVDDTGTPIAVLSVKDIIDEMVRLLVKDVLPAAARAV